MADAGMQHWEAEMDYIGDMLGTDGNTGDKTTDATLHGELQEAMPVIDAQATQAELTDVIAETGAAVQTEETPSAPVVTAQAIEDLKGDIYQLIEAAGIKLALPLQSIAHVLDNQHPIEEGVLDYMGEKYRVIDLHRLIRPDDTDAKVENYILVTDNHVALACEKVLDMRGIDSKEVCWRDGSSQRGWLAGTIKQQGIAFLELDAFCQTTTGL